MLTLTVKNGEGLMIGDYLVVAGPDRELSVDAPRSVPIRRVKGDDLQRELEKRKIPVAKPQQ